MYVQLRVSTSCTSNKNWRLRFCKKVCASVGQTETWVRQPRSPKLISSSFDVLKYLDMYFRVHIDWKQCRTRRHCFDS